MFDDDLHPPPRGITTTPPGARHVRKPHYHRHPPLLLTRAIPSPPAVMPTAPQRRGSVGCGHPQPYVGAVKA